MTRRFDWRRILVGLAAPVLAILLAVLISSLVLLATGNSPITAFSRMWEYGTRARTLAMILNQATPYYLAAIAVAIGFRMNLFNIGVDGQYRIAAMLGAALAGNISLPGPLHVTVTIVVAVLLGAAWAGIAGVLKVTRGVSEVISTIMLNAIATAVVAFLLSPGRMAEAITGSNNIGTKLIPPSGRVPGLQLIPDTKVKVYGLILMAAAVGIGYWVLLNRTRFGYDLRATGRSEAAAVASGVNVKRMVVASMLLSGGTAGLIGMPQLLGASYTYSLDFPAGIGFTGIAIALLGRNHPVGIAFGALLWAFLDQSAQILNIEGIPTEIVVIMQGTIVLCVVIAYEIVRRYRVAQEQRHVGRELTVGMPAEVKGTLA